MYRWRGGGIEVLLVHPGGPFFRRQDDGYWGIPKGEYADGEEAIACARREFAEEIGQPPPVGPMIPLGDVRQRNAKIVTAWAVEGDLDASAIVSNTFVLEWPPRSGRQQEFPEVDRAGWFDPQEAAVKMIEAQRVLVERLMAALASGALEAADAGEEVRPVSARRRDG